MTVATNPMRDDEESPHQIIYDRRQHVAPQYVSSSTSRANQGNVSNIHRKCIAIFLRDIVLGCVYGVIAIILLVVLDHHDILHLESVHHLRDLALQSLDNPESIASLEESSGLKFTSMDLYNFWMYELHDAPLKIKKSKNEIQRSVNNLETIREEMKPLMEEYDNLMSNPLVDLDKFCGSCSWNGGTSCDMRAGYLMQTYKDSEVKAKFALMKSTPSCKQE